MLITQIHKLIEESAVIREITPASLIETHISWIILCDHYVYKIKKPVHYSFLDFSTLEKRKFYCEREVYLNQRLTENIYIGVLPVTQNNVKVEIGNQGSIIDYCVKMVKMAPEKQMDKLLAKNLVGNNDIIRLANKIASFHANAEIIYQKDILDIGIKFKDLAQQKEFVMKHLDAKFAKLLDEVIAKSDCFLQNSMTNIDRRNREGLFRDVHGDLHCKNIFLLPEPQPFDCIEFNDEYRQIDVLNEIAFLCMDLEALKRKDLADLFFNCYNKVFPSVKTEEDVKLFVYYKSYRANIRAKVNCLRAMSNCSSYEKYIYVQEVKKYLTLMEEYMNKIL